MRNIVDSLKPITTVAIAALFISAVRLAEAGPPVLLLKQGDTFPADVQPGSVGSIRSVSVTESGGWVASVSFDDDPRVRGFVGKLNSLDAHPSVLLSTNTLPSDPHYRQVFFKQQFAIVDPNQPLTPINLCVSAMMRSGACIQGFRPSRSFTDSLCIDQDVRVREWGEIADEVVWRSIMPVSSTSNGQFAWIGGLGSPGSKQAFGNGLFIGNLADTSFLPMLTSTMPVAGFGFFRTIDNVRETLDAHRTVLNAAVANDGNAFLAQVRIKTPQSNTDEAIVLGKLDYDESGYPLYRALGRFPDTYTYRKGLPLSAMGTPGGVWTSFNALSISRSDTNQPLWMIAGTVQDPVSAGISRSVIVQGFQTRSAVLLASDWSVDGETITGPFSHATMNNQGDTATVCGISGGSRRAVVVNNKIVLRQGDVVPLDTNGQTHGTVTNILGQNNLALSDRRPDRSVSLYVILNTSPYPQTVSTSASKPLCELTSRPQRSGVSPIITTAAMSVSKTSSIFSTRGSRSSQRPTSTTAAASPCRTSSTSLLHGSPAADPPLAAGSRKHPSGSFKHAYARRPSLRSSV